jgi:hypothetical protein
VVCYVAENIEKYHHYPELAEFSEAMTKQIDRWVRSRRRVWGHVGDTCEEHEPDIAAALLRLEGAL